MTNSNLSITENKSLITQAKMLKRQQTDMRNLAALEQKINEMPLVDAILAKQLHHLVTNIAPNLQAKTWYGMPAYTNDDKKIIFFFQPAAKFSARYASIGFNDTANLDNGDFWPTTFAIKTWTPHVAKQVENLIRTAL
ncbi:hypothetical protein [Periweissella beninensis]|uniref:YdhG-like domain-containing protein n=1 Tax=Periweissella beninensis TaxID=504936 RepID=A0ABT0VNG6_9LACO|nr:hypothetical protein [Periweissella beninensis]MBM7544571.1 uncharacterized protein YdhG (YjbR/CyaY superfamily) [Periweissella beninensis]MCM2438070.1 hypothetical protein [Periweissella beninensis]MCT4396464.1 hypothetical protein [Periweissella beninensis]